MRFECVSTLAVTLRIVNCTDFMDINFICDLSMFLFLQLYNFVTVDFIDFTNTNFISMF